VKEFKKLCVHYARNSSQTEEELTNRIGQLVEVFK